MFWNKLFKKNYKTNLCRNLSNEAAGNYAVKKLEISQLEFYTNNIEPFIKFLRDLKIDKNERMEWSGYEKFILLAHS